MALQLVSTIHFDGHIALEWEDVLEKVSYSQAGLENQLFSIFKKTAPDTPLKWLITLGLCDPSIPLSLSLDFWRQYAALWIRLIRNNPDCETQRDLFSVDIDSGDLADAVKTFPPMTGSEYVTEDFFRETWFKLNVTYQSLAKTYRGPIESLFQSLSLQQTHTDRIHFHLVENRKNEARPFAFLATYTVRAGENGNVKHLPLKAALQEFSGNNTKLLELLSTVNRVAKKNALIESFSNSGELFNPVALTVSEADSFLRSVPEFESAGILCRIPRWWRGPKRASVSLSIGNLTPSRLNADALLEFNVFLSIDNEIVSSDEARKIAELAEGLAFIKGKWIAVDIDSLRSSLDLLDKARHLSQSKNISFAEAMKLLAGVGSAKNTMPAGLDVTCGEWMTQLLEKMCNPKLIRTTNPSNLLKATLRPYQQQGLNWLHFLHTLGFGSCLADDMGLGKTVQVLAFLQLLKAPLRCSLIVVPSSLISNWQSEIEKFTPDLKAIVLHPQVDSQFFPTDALKAIDNYDIAITTYGMLQRISDIEKHEWYYVICDEAQALKNPLTKQTVAVKKLQCKHALVLTGTPVENRLTDLWSLFDFINPGLLGSFGEFKKFSNKLKEEHELFGKLRRAVQPYILRRCKSDKSIINDLPDKIEMKTYCELSRDQILIYKKLVSNLEDEIKNADVMVRRGIILGYLMKCKQLCNHPDHFSGTGPYDSSHSGKFRRIAEICETIREKREKVLVFTQFREIIQPLETFLSGIFNAKGVTLSGSSSLEQRKKAVAVFQSDTEYVPFFILSLKAGGTGLNLTKANHVIHFDRWWNPAVENQATDRAYRIGQKKNVLVHKFICKGTIEDKIDQMIDDKRMLADEVLASGKENWITEFDDAKIKEMFKLTLGSEMVE